MEVVIDDIGLFLASVHEGLLSQKNTAPLNSKLGSPSMDAARLRGYPASVLPRGLPIQF